MKAWVLRGIGDLRFEDAPKPTPKSGETLVKVKCAGICSSDVPRVFTTGAYHYPIILGHEFSGETEDGRRVGVFPLIPCFECAECRGGRYETCSDYDYIGSRRDGAFAEYVSVPEWNLIDIPNAMSFEVAALLEPAAVALHAVKQLGGLRDVSSAAVIGSGVIGQFASRWLSIYKVENVELIGRGDKPRLDRYDACVEAAGSAEALSRCVDLTRPNGHIALIGNPHAEFRLEQKQYWPILRKQITMHGSWNSSYPADWREAIENASQLQIDELISHQYSFDDLNSAFMMMRENKEKHCKVLVIN